MEKKIALGPNGDLDLVCSGGNVSMKVEASQLNGQVVEEGSVSVPLAPLLKGLAAQGIAKLPVALQAIANVVVDALISELVSL